MKPPASRVHIATATDVGCVRTNNEDSVGKDDRAGLAVLADGMGGHNAGEIAGAIAVGTILNELSRALPTVAPNAPGDDGGYSRQGALIREAVGKANQAIYQAAAQNLAYQGMGTTVVVAAFHGDCISVAHVGDSRLYRLRGGSMEQLTTDHSLGNELIANGYFKTMEEVVAAGLKNAITRALGLDAEVRVDLREDAVLADDVYLICSDGLTDMVADAEIQRIVEHHGTDLERSVAHLIAVAKKNGGKDNVSAILARPVSAEAGNSTRHRRPGRWLGNLFATGK